MPVLIDDLDDENPKVRIGATYALGVYGKAAMLAVPSIQRNLRAEDPMLPLFSAWSLAHINGGNPEIAQQAAPLLIKALDRPEPLVRIEAANALGMLAPNTPGVVEALTKAEKTATDPNLKRAIQAALEQNRQ